MQAPSGWPREATALKLTPEELDRYPAREALELNPADLVDIHLEIDAAKHARTLPPPSAGRWPTSGSTRT